MNNEKDAVAELFDDMEDTQVQVQRWRRGKIVVIAYN